MSKLIDIQPKPLSLNDIILNVCDTALSDIKSSEDFDMVLQELVQWGYIKQPQHRLFESGFLQQEENRYMITSKGVLAFRLQIISPIKKMCDDDIEIKEHLNKIKKILRDENDVVKRVIAECLNNAVLITELVKAITSMMGS